MGKEKITNNSGTTIYIVRNGHAVALVDGQTNTGDADGFWARCNPGDLNCELYGDKYLRVYKIGDGSNITINSSFNLSGNVSCGWFDHCGWLSEIPVRDVDCNRLNPFSAVLRDIEWKTYNNEETFTNCANQEESLNAPELANANYFIQACGSSIQTSGSVSSDQCDYTGVCSDYSDGYGVVFYGGTNCEAAPNQRLAHENHGEWVNLQDQYPHLQDNIHSVKIAHNWSVRVYEHF